MQIGTLGPEPPDLYKCGGRYARGRGTARLRPEMGLPLMERLDELYIDERDLFTWLLEMSVCSAIGDVHVTP